MNNVVYSLSLEKIFPQSLCIEYLALNDTYRRTLTYNPFSSQFNHTSASYKYYWLLSILSELEKGNTVIPKHQIFAGMIALAWYTVNCFHISFGKQDQL